MTFSNAVFTLWSLAPVGPAAMQAPATDTAAALVQRVEIHRTEYGVPHILADDLKAMGFGLGYVQSEAYSASIAVAMMASRGVLARHLGAEELDADFAARETHARAVETFHRLDPRARQVYHGFAEGVNHYIRLHPDEYPPWVEPDFTGVDALARDVQGWSRGDAARFVTRLRAAEGAGRGGGGPEAGAGSVQRDSATTEPMGRNGCPRETPTISSSTGPMRGRFTAAAPSRGGRSSSATPTSAGTETTICSSASPG